MTYGTYLDTAIGKLYLAVENGKVVQLTRAADGAAKAVQPPAEDADAEVLEKAAGEIMEYLEGKRRSFQIPIQMSGTPFQEKVWEALRGIPYGETRSYGEIAAQAGSPGGARAVGAACGRNPIMILVPCHRVVGSGGKLVGFGGGLPMKEYLLALERRNR